jgi:hypothetical protein
MRRSIRVLVALLACLVTLGVIPSPASAVFVITRHKATLVGSEVVPGPGDPDATAKATLTLKPGKPILCWKVTEYANIDTNGLAAYIGKAKKGANPESLLDYDSLGPVSFAGDGDCYNPDRKYIRQYQRWACGGTLFFQLENATYPDGAVRGQLSKKC